MRQFKRTGMSTWGAGLGVLGLLISVCIMIYLFQSMADVSLSTGSSMRKDLMDVQEIRKEQMERYNNPVDSGYRPAPEDAQDEPADDTGSAGRVSLRDESPSPASQPASRPARRRRHRRRQRRRTGARGLGGIMRGLDEKASQRNRELEKAMEND